MRRYSFPALLALAAGCGSLQAYNPAGLGDETGINSDADTDTDTDTDRNYIDLCHHIHRGVVLVACAGHLV